MQTLNEKEFKDMLNSGNITPYNIYNLDIDYPQLYSIENYINNPNDTIEQEQAINKLFVDIECFTNNDPKTSISQQTIQTANWPINAMTIYSTFEKIYYAYILLYNENITKFPVDDIKNLENEFYEILKKENYLKNDETIKIKYFTYETDLIKAVWNNIHKIDPAILSGWNSDNFDFPYIYYRLYNLFDKNYKSVDKIMSKFESVKLQKMGDNVIIKIPDYPILDLMYLYKPREEGGMNYGKKQPSYSLDWISDIHLKRKKLDYKKKGMTLDTLFLEDPVNFLLYNIMDTSLCVGLDETLKHIDHHNMYRRLMKTSLDASIRGSSVLFDTFVLYELKKNSKYIRFGINDETSFEISQQDLKNLPQPSGKKKIQWNVTSLEANLVKKISSTYPGAYVKESPGKLFTSNDGMIIGLDASSLYPSMILQQNISFDSFFGRIIDPNIHKTLEFIKNNIDNHKILNQICGNILELCIDYVERTKPTNKNNAYQYNYYLTSYIFTKIIKECKDFNNLLQPKNYKDYLLLKNYFLVLIDMMEKIHKNATEYNSFCYDWFINDGKNTKNTYIYIIENFYNPHICINRINVNDFNDYLRQKKLLVTLSGGLFYQHDAKLGLFSEWLNIMGKQRKQYKNLRDEYEVKISKDCAEAKFYDMTQKAVKVAMNTSYGLYGLTSFRYSNSHLAKAITTQGRYILKICQQISDMYIERYKNQS